MFEVVVDEVVVIGAVVVCIVAFSGSTIGLITTVANKTAIVVSFKKIPQGDIFG